MRKCTQKILNLFFNEGEHICISHNDYGYHSVSQTSLKGAIEQISPSDKVGIEYINETDIVLMSLNPVNGFRKDENVTAYRSFLVELDDGDLADQMKYIEDSGLPYSMCVFSGNKSLHFGITLKEDIPEEYMWRDIAEWILSILDKADPMTKNPTRSIRFPNNMRKNGKKLQQKLLKFKGRVDNGKLASWLQKYPELNPAMIRKNAPKPVVKTVNGIPMWVINKLVEGVEDEGKGRNTAWFMIAMELAKTGLSAEEMIAYTEQYFSPERDFGTYEWENIMKHAHKRAQRVI